MLVVLLASLLSVAASWMMPGSQHVLQRRGCALHRTGAPVACTPIRSDDEFDYFRRSRELTIELTKPLGAVLEEAAAGGVQVLEVVEGGSAFETGLLKKRDRLVNISGVDVATASFDEVRPPRVGPSVTPAHPFASLPRVRLAAWQAMEVLSSAAEELSLGIARTVIVKVKRVVEAALLGQRWRLAGSTRSAASVPPRLLSALGRRLPGALSAAQASRARWHAASAPQ